jgi:hypothetical protein
VKCNVVEARLDHQRLKRILVGVHPDRLGEISVAVAVAGGQLPEPRSTLKLYQS